MFDLSFPDLINGILEGVGGFFIALSVRKLHRAKVVSGVSAIHVAFFSAWGFWNLFYYPHLDQWVSFWGGVLLVAVNCVWLGQIFYYWQPEIGPQRAQQRRWVAAASGGHDGPGEPTRLLPGERIVKGPYEPRGECNPVFAEMTDDQFGGFNRNYGRTPRFRHNDK